MKKFILTSLFAATLAFGQFPPPFCPPMCPTPTPTPWYCEFLPWLEACNPNQVIQTITIPAGSELDSKLTEVVAVETQVVVAESSN